MPVWSSGAGGGLSRANRSFTGVGGGPGRLSQAQYNATRRFHREIHAATEIAMLQGARDAVAAAEGAISEEMANITKLVSQMSPQRRKQIHQEVGLAAQRSTRAAYSNRRHRKRTPSSRITTKNERNRRYAGGALLRVIGAPDFFEATPSGLKFINVTRLNKEAKQWRRINFGAGGRAGDPPKRFEVSWDGMIVATMGLEPDPRPAFRIPKGYWFADGQRVGAGGGNEFFPVGEQPKGTRGRPSPGRMTRGIAASNFLDAGIRRIAREMPKAYTAALQQILDAEFRAKTSKTVPAPTIRAPKIRLSRI